MRNSNIYLALTQEFNDGRLRSILSGGQAVVLHRLAIMSKDGYWILREDSESLDFVLRVLERHGARYRFGAPLDVRWMAGGWSSHFEFARESLRVRTDFVTRPPRLTSRDLAGMWREQEADWSARGSEGALPVAGLRELADMKKTNREKDYAVIGELARRMAGPADQLLYSRSARDLARLAQAHAGLAEDLIPRRPLLRMAQGNSDALEEALDRERRQLIHANERRIMAYLEAARPWQDAWPAVSREITALPLAAAHRFMVEKALPLLPFQVAGGLADG